MQAPINTAGFQSLSARSHPLPDQKDVLAKAVSPEFNGIDATRLPPADPKPKAVKQTRMSVPSTRLSRPPQQLIKVSPEEADARWDATLEAVKEDPESFGDLI